MLRLSSMLLALGTLFSAATNVGAQCVPIPGTGCPGATPLICLGPPRIGQVAQVSYAGNGLVVAQLSLDGPVWPLPLPLACAPGCFLAGTPLVYTMGFGATQLLFMVPNDPLFVGFTYIGQGYMVPAGQNCVTASNAIRGTVVP